MVKEFVVLTIKATKIHRRSSMVREFVALIAKAIYGWFIALPLKVTRWNSHKNNINFFMLKKGLSSRGSLDQSLIEIETYCLEGRNC